MLDAAPCVRDALESALKAAASYEAPELAAADEAEATRSLAALEVQVWLELDQLLSTLARLRGPQNKMPVPSQLLGLLPPPPVPGGWPVDFELARVAAQLCERFATAQEEGEGDALANVLHFVPVDHEYYPARRRAQKLSYAVWAVIGGEGVELQPLLEVESTGDRLRLALQRVRDVMQQIQ